MPTFLDRHDASGMTAEDFAEAGAILVSREVCDAAGVADDATPLGPIVLKGLAEPVPVFSVGWR